eukprot:TRINITY_DN2768_c0_g1_i1.p1 TRINITY_DN2768_c0_g1~~TRINITY_DN2768_c0_g1_i1.p1  ORF type:complete len:283 (+),score=25.92 TRINITY_DN2768_c0_g1_i1:1017-1865(+)
MTPTPVRQVLSKNCFAPCCTRYRKEATETLSSDIPPLYLSCRRELVDWLWEVAEEFHILNHTYHLAVRLMDRFHSCTVFDISHYQLNALVHIIIAAKMEEIAPPSFQELEQKCRFSEASMRQMELVVLQQLGWNCNPVTASSFVGLYLVGAVRSHDVVFYEETGQTHDVTEEMQFYVRQYASFFVDLAVQDGKISTLFAPSVIAAAGVVAARRFLHLSPPMDDALCAFLGHPSSVVSTCLDQLNACYIATFGEEDTKAVNSPDQLAAFPRSQDSQESVAMAQ